MEQADHREWMVKNKYLRIEGGGKEGELQTLSVTTVNRSRKQQRLPFAASELVSQRHHLKPHTINDGWWRWITLRKTLPLVTPSRKENEANGTAKLAVSKGVSRKEFLNPSEFKNRAGRDANRPRAENRTSQASPPPLHLEFLCV